LSAIISKHAPDSRTDIEDGPLALSLRDGSLLLYQKSGNSIRLSIADSGRQLSLNGTLAERVSSFLESPNSVAFPSLGPLLHQHPWLRDLKDVQAAPTPSERLLGNELGMLFVELTDRCNERCVHCYAESSPDCSARLSRKEISHVLEQARRLGRPTVQFTGGDPLLHPDLLFAVQTAHELDYQAVEIYTNGLALSESLLEKLSPFQPRFAFSVYAHDAAIHDRITQTPGSLQRTLRAIRRIQDAKLQLRVGIILMTENRELQDATADFLMQDMHLDAAQIGFDIVRSTGRGTFMQDFQLDTESHKRFIHRADTPASVTPAQTNNRNPKQKKRRGKLCVSASGDVFPCIFSRRSRLGNIREQALTDIIQSLDTRLQPTPSAERWRQCQQQLSCSDCQAIAYLLGDSTTEKSARQGDMRGTT